MPFLESLFYTKKLFCILKNTPMNTRGTTAKDVIPNNLYRPSNKLNDFHDFVYKM